jgi:eukaryotic-like serine/threonine-protein kinase
METDRNLMFGALALQAQLITKEQFADACTAWMEKPTRPLADLLIERGWITATARSGLEQRLGIFANDKPKGGATHPQRTGAEKAAKYPTVPGYDILSTVGAGGMAVVFKARQIRVNRIVALKMVLDPTRTAPGDLVRFLMEGELLAKLHHPNIVEVFEVGKHELATGESRPFMALEFVDGGSIESLQRGKPRPPREAAALVETLARAMHVAHTHGVVHRDLKPSNILLTRNGVPKITDFGLARQVDVVTGLTDTGVTVGTPNYMAPEQTYGSSAVGPAADIHALGGILYELLTGQPPFQGHSAVETMAKVATQPPAPPSQAVPGLPSDLEAICLKCLAKQPAGRYATAEALAADLHGFLQDEPIASRKQTLAEILRRQVRKNPKAILLAGTVAAFFAACVWYLASGSAVTVSSPPTAPGNAEPIRQLHAAIEQTANRFEKNGEVLYGLAGLAATAAKATTSDAQAAERLSQLAVEMLCKAKTAGFFSDAVKVDQLKQDSVFDGIRDREDFRKIAEGLRPSLP